MADEVTDFVIELPELEERGIDASRLPRILIAAVDTERPILVIGDAVFHGQHRQLVGTAAVVAPRANDDGVASDAAAAVVAVTSRAITFKLASGHLDSILSSLLPSCEPPPPKKKAKITADAGAT